MEIREGIASGERQQEIKNRLNGLFSHIKKPKDRELLTEHHREIVENFYINNPEVPFPTKVLLASDWQNLRRGVLKQLDLRRLKETDLVFVDGGILEEELGVDAGRAILINDGGIIEANIRCGRFHKDGGIIGDKVSIEERLLIGTNQK